MPDLAEKSGANFPDRSSPAQQPLCVYCGSKGPFTDEHVLARAFAGPGENWMLKDFVCGECNKLFSTYERAWTSAPGEAAARIHWGPAARKRKGVAYHAHPSENIFLMVKDDPISCEADILRDTVPRLRAQMISAKDQIFAMASAPEDAKRLTDAVNAFAFWNAPEITIQKRLERVIGLVRLYGGTIYRVHLGQAPAGTGLFTKTVWIDYNGPGRVPVAPQQR